ncbi:MAG: 1-acyl-sn-glycerol-3-phosphate acyltransferase [Ginsengibacter sp.]
MLYKLLFIPSRIALWFYCRKIVVNNKAMLSEGGPLLIASNHPNSFLDAVIVATLFKHPVYSLARGDAFAGKFLTKILNSLNMLPVYRVSEGVENLEQNYTTFDACQQLFEENKIVLIFSEGRCINEWHLRPLKKGTARMALNAWENNIPLRVLPLGINYSSFRFYGKNVFLNFGSIISKNDFDTQISAAKCLNLFNKKLNQQLEKLVFEINENDREKAKDYFQMNQPLVKRVLLSIPAIIGFATGAPLYFVLHLIIKNRAHDHYDSVMTGLLFFLYPLYLLIITAFIFFYTKNAFFFLLLILLPFCTWSYLQIKKQI